MKNSLLLIIVLMTITLGGCQRNQTVSTSGFLKDSCLIVTFADSLEFRYQLVVDSINGIVKMKDSYKKVFISDIQKHGSIFKGAYVTPDISEDCRGKGFEVCDSVNYKLYRIQFTEPAGWLISREISFEFESAKGFFRNKNAGSEFLEPSGPYLDWKK